MNAREVFKKNVIAMSDYLKDREQALEIIVKKKVEVNVLVYYTCKSAKDYNDYVRLHYSCFKFFKEEEYYLTQEEYDLVSKVVKEIGENERR